MTETNIALRLKQFGALRRVRLRDLPMHQFDPVAASVLFQLAFLVSAVLGIVRQMLFNSQFGTGADANAYVAAFRLPETLLNLIGGGALSGALVPVLLHTRREDGDEAERRLAEATLVAIGVVTIGAVAVGMIFAGPFVRGVLAPGFDGPTSALAIALTRLMLLQPLLLLLSTVAVAVLVSRSQFFLPALSVALHNIVLIGSLLVARAVPSSGIFAPVVGLLFDSVLQAVILLPGLRANGFRLLPNMLTTKTRRHEVVTRISRLRVFVVHVATTQRLREVVRLMVPSGLSAIVNYSGTIVDTAAASFAREPGALPAIGSALLLIGLPTRLLGQAVGAGVFPRLAAHASAHEWPAMRRLLLQALAIACGLAVPAALGLIVLGRWIVGLLFERGAFGTEAADLTYLALVAYALGLPFYIGTDLCTRALTALYDTRTPLLTNLLQVAGRIGMIVVLLGPLGAVAIPLAFAATSAFETCILGAVVWWKLNKETKDERPTTKA